MCVNVHGNVYIRRKASSVRSRKDTDTSTRKQTYLCLHVYRHTRSTHVNTEAQAHARALARAHTQTHTHTHLGATALGTRRPCRLRLIPPAVPVLVLVGPGLVDVGDLPAQVLKGVVHWVGAEGLR